MINKTKPVIFFLLQFLFLQGAISQNQKNVTDYIRQRFLSYCKSVPREEIFVHTDREEYIAGEDLWFNIYLFDRQSFSTSLNSKIGYFEILNPDNRPVVQKRIRIDQGFGPGHFVLPDTLSTGIYTIRTYTSWMKNFLPFNCFMKEIKVYNAISTRTFMRRVSGLDTLRGGNGSGSDIWPINPGITLKVNNFRPDFVEIIVNADENYCTENNNLFILFIQTHGIINHISSERIAEGNAEIQVPKTLLTSGINQITIFDAQGKPIGERYIYTPSGKEKQFVTLRSANSFSNRSIISLEFEIEDESFSALNPANLSISVAPETKMPESLELNEYMIFGTEFGLFPLTKKGKKISEFPPDVMDSLLLTVRSNWIRWDMIFSEYMLLFSYQIEKEDHYLLGKIVNVDPQPLHSDELVLLSTPGKTAQFQYTSTDYDGNFSFNISVDEGLKDYLIQPDDISKKHKTYIESSFSDKFLPYRISVDSARIKIPSYISKWSANYQVRKIYESSSVGDLLTPLIPLPKPIRFYGKPDFELVMKDFIKLPSMEEVFFELIPRVTLKKNMDVYEISFVDISGNKIYDVAPVLMIDGVKIHDPSIIASLDPELVEKIDIVRERYIVGDYLFHGIVNIITKTGDFRSVTTPEYATRQAYRVIDPVGTFISPDYSSQESRNKRIPDFRNTLYWNPSVKPDKDGKAKVEFWTSDVTSDYEINIQGITSDGKTVSLRRVIKVK